MVHAILYGKRGESHFDIHHIGRTHFSPRLEIQMMLVVVVNISTLVTDDLSSGSGVILWGFEVKMPKDLNRRQ